MRNRYSQMNTVIPRRGGAPRRAWSSGGFLILGLILALMPAPPGISAASLPAPGPSSDPKVHAFPAPRANPPFSDDASDKRTDQELKSRSALLARGQLAGATSEHADQRELFDEARAAFSRGSYASARALYQRLLNEYPTFRDYYLRDLGRMVLLEANDVMLSPEASDLCLDYGDRIIEEQGTLLSGWGRYFRGRAFLSLKRPEEAETELSLALAEDAGPPLAVLERYLGLALELSGKPCDAYEYYRRCADDADGELAVFCQSETDRFRDILADADCDADWRLALESFERQLPRRASSELLSKIREKGQNCPYEEHALAFRRLEGRCMLELGQFDAGKAVLLSVLDLETARGEPQWSTIATLQDQLGKRQDSAGRRQLLETFIAAGPGEEGSPAYLTLARLLKDEGDRAGAVAVYEALARRFPKGAYTTDALWALAWEKVRMGDHGSAIEDLKEQLELVAEGSQEEARARYWLGRLLMDTGSQREGIVVLEDVFHRFHYSYYGILAGWKMNQGRPSLWAGSEPAVTSGAAPSTAGQPEVLASALLFSDLERNLQGIEPEGPAEHLSKAVEFYLMGEDSASIRELHAGAYHRDISSQARWMAAALRHAMGSFYHGLRYGMSYLASLTAEEPVVPARIALACPIKYRSIIYQQAQSRGIEPGLIAAIILEESSFNSHAGSPAGARGLMQLMPGTARLVSHRLGIGYQPGNLSSPAYNITLGAEYLRIMLETFDGHVVEALAAYNAGEGSVRRWKKQLGAVEDDFFGEEIPYRETRGYVREVLTSMSGYRAAYGAGTSTPTKAPEDAPAQEDDAAE